MDDVVFILEEARRQDFGKTADGGKRRLQFMGYIGRKFPPQLFPVFLFGHIIDDEQHAVEIIIFIDWLKSQQIEAVRPHEFRLTDTVHMLQPVPGRIGKEFLEVALQDSLCIPSAQEAGCPQVEAGNAIGFIRQDDAFLEIFHDEAHDIALLFQTAHIIRNGLALQKDLVH